MPIQPAPIDHGPRARLRARAAMRVGVGERAQVVDAVELGARHRQPPRLGAGGEQQPVEAEPLAAGERRLARRVASIAVTEVPVSSSISCSA